MIGITGIILFSGYNNSIEYSLQTTFVRKLGHLQVQHKDYLLYGSGSPLDYSISDYKRIIDVITNDVILKDMVTVVTPFLQLNGIASNYFRGTSKPVLIYGNDSTSQKRLNEWDEYNISNILDQYSPLNTDVPDAAIIGKGLARILQLCHMIDDKSCEKLSTVENISDDEKLPLDLMHLSDIASKNKQSSEKNYIDLLTASNGGAPNIVKIQANEVQPQPAREIDDSFINIHLEQAQQLLFGKSQPGVTGITVQLKSTKQLAVAKDHLHKILQDNFPNLEMAVYEFSEIQPLYDEIIKMFNNIFNFLLVLILGIVLFTVSNTMSMAILERTAEIGTLRAIGFKRYKIQLLFLCEGTLLGIIGIISGLIISIIMSILINSSGLTWQPPGVIEPIPINISVWGEWSMIFAVASVLFMMTIISSWFPAKRAANLYIVQALRHV